MEVPTRGKTTEFSLAGRIASALVGPVLGMLPPRWQLKVTNGNADAARIMSTSSRLTNGLYGIYAASSLICRMVGIDIDPTEGNHVTAVGVIIGVDTIVRESLYRSAYYLSMHQNHPDPGMTYTEVWGEPILSIVDAMVSKEK